MKYDQTPSKQGVHLGITINTSGSGSSSTDLTRIKETFTSFNNTLETIIDEYVNNNLDTINNNTNISKLSNMSYLLEQYKTPYRDLDGTMKVIDLMQDIIQGVVNTLQLHTTQEQSETTISILQDENNTYKYLLENEDALNAYLNQQKAAYSIIPSQSFNAMSATLKPEYEIYILMYGFPPNAIFDTTKLQTIIVDINRGKYKTYFNSKK